MDVEDEYCDGDNLQKWLLDGEAFKATGLMIEERNWLDVYDKWEKWSGNKVATLKVGDTFDPQCMQMKANKTQPPLPLTESDLISAMDRNGIGTDGMFFLGRDKVLKSITAYKYVSRSYNCSAHNYYSGKFYFSPSMLCRLNNC